MEDLNKAGQQLTREISSVEMLDSLVDRIRETTKSDIVILYPYKEISALPVEERFEEPHLSGDLLEPIMNRSSVREDDIAWLSLQKEEVWATDSGRLFDLVSGCEHSRKGNFEVREKIASIAVLSLKIEGESVGVLFINYRATQLFREAQRNFIRGLANFAAIAINNNRSFRDLTTHRLEELELLREIDLEISGSVDLKSVLQTILRRASGNVGGDESAILLYNRHTNQLETEVCNGRSESEYRDFAVQTDGPGLIAKAYQTGNAIRVGNVKTDPNYHELLKDTLSELDVPLKGQTEVVGVINFESSKLGAFTQAHEDFLVTLAGQAVLAIKKAQIYDQAERRRRNLESLHEITKEIVAQRGDPAKVIEFILSKARTLIDAEGGLFQLYAGTVPGKHFVDANDELTKQSLNLRQESGFELGIVKHVAEIKEPHTTIGIDAQDDSLYTGSESIHSESAVPLLTEEGELIAVLDLESPRKFAFDAEDERALVLFGELAVIAIKNARDYARAEDESKHAKDEWKRFQLLWRAGSELAEIIDPEQLKSAYNIVIAKIGEFSEGEVVIRRYDPITEELLRVAVGREREMKPLASIRKSEGISGQVARDLHTIIVHDLEHLPPGVATPVADDPSIKTLLVTPLLFENLYYGNLVLSGDRPYSLDQADINLLEGLAKQLAITIHRLETAKEKAEVEQQARDLTFMSEFGQSSMEIAHRLANRLGAITEYLKSIRKISKTKALENPSIAADLDRVEFILKELMDMATGIRQRIPELGKARERTIAPVDGLIQDAVSSGSVPEAFTTDFDIQSDLPNVHIVYNHVVDILNNLVTNAVEAMPEGGTISIRASYERGLVDNPSQHVTLEIRDDGPGIPHENLDKVFSLFFSTKGSTGFGLWSARQYARLNGGDLTISSAKGEGTTFTLTLPVAVKHRVE